MDFARVVLEVYHVAVLVGAQDVVPVLGEILPYVRDAGSVPGAGVGVVRWVYGAADLEFFACAGGRGGGFLC